MEYITLVEDESEGQNGEVNYFELRKIPINNDMSNVILHIGLYEKNVEKRRYIAYL